MTALILRGTLATVCGQLMQAPRGITVKQWLSPAVYPDYNTACKAAHSARDHEGRADIHAEPDNSLGGWIVYMEPRNIMRADGSFINSRASGKQGG